MSGGPPALIAIDHDDYHAEHVGRTADGRQFFLTTPFEPGGGPQIPSEEFVALCAHERGVWSVELEPGNYMACSEPWDSGEYDT